jgi:hypothetical protein
MRLEALNNAGPDKAMSPDRSVSWSEATVADRQIATTPI